MLSQSLLSALTPEELVHYASLDCHRSPIISDLCECVLLLREQLREELDKQFQEQHNKHRDELDKALQEQHNKHRDELLEQEEKRSKEYDLAVNRLTEMHKYEMDKLRNTLRLNFPTACPTCLAPLGTTND